MQSENTLTDVPFSNSFPPAKILIRIDECLADPRKPDSEVYVYRFSIGPNLRSLYDIIESGTDDGKLAVPISQIMTAASVKWWLAQLPHAAVEINPVELSSGDSLSLSAAQIMHRLATRLGVMTIPTNWVFP